MKAKLRFEENSQEKKGIICDHKIENIAFFFFVAKIEI